MGSRSIPILPPVGLLAARSLKAYGLQMGERVDWHRAPATVYMLLGLVLLLLPLLPLGSDLGDVSFGNTFLTAIGCLILGAFMLLIPRASAERSVRIVALSCPAVIAILVGGAHGLFCRYDLSPMARQLKRAQTDGYRIVHRGQYHGEYQFLGRLTEPLVVSEHRRDAAKYITGDERTLLLAYTKSDEPVNADDALYQHSYRGQKAILWTHTGACRFLANPSPAC